MGSDRAPAPEVEGALAVCAELADDDRIVLVGNEQTIRRELDRLGVTDSEKIEIRHADQRISMGESPVESVRIKSSSSIAVMVQMHADGDLDACISAGNTGAFVSAAQMRLRRLPGVNRPGIAIIIPTVHGPVTLCEAGANISCRPQHLYQYSVMASIYTESVVGIKNPRVGLLSVGQEDAKGNDLVRAAHGLLRADSMLYFIGNVEGRDVFHGACDVVICDGFVGNVVLKLIEGLSEGLIRDILNNLKDLTTSSPELTEIAMKAARKTLKAYDYNEYGGAPLLGVGGISVICHGASGPRAIQNAVLKAKKFASQHVNERITKRLTREERISNG